jgi:glycosyltransferase involved in cell wall biosynthesis
MSRSGIWPAFQWDVDLLNGYPHEFLETTSGSVHTRFNGVELTEDLGERMRRRGVQALWVEGWRLRVFWDAIRIAHKNQIDVWLRGESNDLKQDPIWKTLWKRPLLRRLFGQVDQFLCIGSSNRRLYASYGVPSAKLHAAPYFVDNDFFAAQANDLRPHRNEIRQKWHIPADAYCLLFCGKFIQKKRPFDLIDAAQLAANKSGHKLHLLFAGSGDLGTALRARCRVVFDAENSDAKVDPNPQLPGSSFVGFLNQRQIAEAYVAADTLVLPSDSGETWGLVANEALACGCPAIVSDQCGCAEDLVAALDPRSIYSCGKIGSLARAIITAMEAPTEFETVRGAADSHHLRHPLRTIEDLYLSNLDKCGYPGQPPSSSQDLRPTKI